MLTVGVTGSIASGKSLFVSFLAKRGATVIDADRIGHETIRRTGPAFPAVVQAFGPGILGSDGEIDRGALGRIVFRDPEARRRLNDLVHPPLIAELVRRVRRAREAGARLVVVDAALIYEFGLAGEFDAIVVVTSPRPVQIERLKERGLTETEAVERIGSQLEADEKVRRADFHVENPGTPAGLDREAERIWKSLEGLAGRERPGGPFDGKDSTP